MLATCWTLGEVVIKDGDSIAFLGDSLTYFGHRHKPNGYIHLVMEGLDQAGVQATAIPVGIGGNTTGDMLKRLDKDVISKQPTWMTLNSGINDSRVMDLEEFSANLKEIVDRTTAAGIKVILITTTIAAGENLVTAETAKRKTFADAFKKLGQERGLIVVDMNTVMARELRERKPDGVKRLELTYDGTHLNGLGNQIMAAEVLRGMGVSDPEIAALRAKWNHYPYAVAMPEISIRDYVKIKALADQNEISVEAQVSQILTEIAAMKDMSIMDASAAASSKIEVIEDADHLHSRATILQPSDKIAILSGQVFEAWGWAPSGYIRLITDELEKTGMKRPVSINLERKTTGQMLAGLDTDVIAKKPAFVLLIPGNRDYNVYTQSFVDESFTKNLAAIIEKLQAAEIPMVLVTSHAKNSEPAALLNENATEHNEAIRTLAATNQIPLIDLVKVVNEADEIIPLDGSLAAKSLINQMFAAEILHALDMSDEAITAARQAWLDLPGIQFAPSISVNSYEKLKVGAKASGQDPDDYITELLHNM
jgi:lysophospholipase L1-like esterase